MLKPQTCYWINILYENTMLKRIQTNNRDTTKMHYWHKGWEKRELVCKSYKIFKILTDIFSSITPRSNWMGFWVRLAEPPSWDCPPLSAAFFFFFFFFFVGEFSCPGSLSAWSAPEWEGTFSRPARVEGFSFSHAVGTMTDYSKKKRLY